ncbi:unnamed protein product, partial [marine sediment metagenome]
NRVKGYKLGSIECVPHISELLDDLVRIRIDNDGYIANNKGPRANGLNKKELNDISYHPKDRLDNGGTDSLQLIINSLNLIGSEFFYSTAANHSPPFVNILSAPLSLNPPIIASSSYPILSLLYHPYFSLSERQVFPQGEATSPVAVGALLPAVSFLYKEKILSPGMDNAQEDASDTDRDNGGKRRKKDSVTSSSIKVPSDKEIGCFISKVLKPAIKSSPLSEEQKIKLRKPEKLAHLTSVIMANTEESTKKKLHFIDHDNLLKMSSLRGHKG